MNYFTNRNWIIGLLAGLLVLNLSVLFTVLYHIKSENTIQLPKQKNNEIEVPQNRYGRFFKDELNLTNSQHEHFRKFRQQYHNNADKIILQMQQNRVLMLNELAAENSDTLKLNQLADELGVLHTKLKRETFGFYMQMKNICDKEQCKKLNRVFRAMLEPSGEIQMPGQHLRGKNR